MSAAVQNPDLADPLHGYSSLSLLHRTFKDANVAPNPKQDDSESLQSYLESLALKSPNKLLEQANIILNSSSEFQNSEIDQGLQSEDGDKNILTSCRVRRQKRQTALGRKRARFSFAPNTSQPSLVEDVSLNIDQLQDPEEFYAAYEKNERANKELQRQRGEVSTESIWCKSSATARRSRRPGILGKKVTYKHYYPSLVAGSDKADSPETFEVDLSCSSNNKINIETASQHGVLQEPVVTGNGRVGSVQGSVADAGVDGLLDELLSDNNTDLDVDGTLTLLQEHLQIKPIKIKPINLDKLCLPELDSVCKTDDKVSLARVSRPRKALSDVHNVAKKVNSEKLVESHQLGETSSYQHASRTPSKSPLASLMKLKRRIFQGDPHGNPFSFSGINLSPVKHPSFVNDIDIRATSPHLGANNDDVVHPKPGEVDEDGLGFSGKFQTLMTEKDYNAGSNADLDKLVTKESICSPDPVDDNLFEPDSTLQEKVDDIHPEMVAHSYEPELGCEGLTTENLHGGTTQLGPAATINHAEEGHPELIFVGPEQNNEPQQEPSPIASIVKSKQKAPARKSKRKDVHRSGLADNPGPITVENHTEDGLPEVNVICPQQNNKGQKQQESCSISLDVKSKRKAPARGGKKRVDVVHKKSRTDNSESIAVENHAEVDAFVPEQNNEQECPSEASNLENKGETLIHNGGKRKGNETVLRRGSRLKMRPLKYWKGERFLYGRVDPRLLTVIGVKVESPGKDGGKPTMRFKYLKEEYKDRVDKLAY